MWMCVCRCRLVHAPAFNALAVPPSGGVEQLDVQVCACRVLGALVHIGVRASAHGLEPIAQVGSRCPSEKTLQGEPLLKGASCVLA